MMMMMVVVACLIPFQLTMMLLSNLSSPSFYYLSASPLCLSISLSYPSLPRHIVRQPAAVVVVNGYDDSGGVGGGGVV